MAKTVLVIIVLIFLGVGAYYVYSSRSALYPTTVPPSYISPTATAAPGQKETVTLNEQNNSGQMGTATLEEVGGKVNVTLNLSGAPKDVTQPAHIHTGTCANIGGVVYPLTFPVNGTSQTTLNVSLAQLKSAMPLALNIHKSQAESTVYYACGDINL